MAAIDALSFASAIALHPPVISRLKASVLAVVYGTQISAYGTVRSDETFSTTPITRKR
jgi:hypothetical protein